MHRLTVKTFLFSAVHNCKPCEVTYVSRDRMLATQTIVARMFQQCLTGSAVHYMYLRMVHRQGECQTSTLCTQIADACWFGANHCCSALMEAPGGEGSGCWLAWGAPGRRPSDAPRPWIAWHKCLVQMQIMPLRQSRPRDGGHCRTGCQHFLSDYSNMSNSATGHRHPRTRQQQKQV